MLVANHATGSLAANIQVATPSIVSIQLGHGQTLIFIFARLSTIMLKLGCLVPICRTQAAMAMQACPQQLWAES